MLWSQLQKRLRRVLRGHLFRFWRFGARGRNNTLLNFGNLDRVFYDIVGNGNRIVIGTGALVQNVTFYMRGNNHLLEIGSGCRISGGSIWFEDSDCDVRIGDRTSMESAHLAVTESGRKIEIGAGCMFAHNIQVRVGDSHSIFLEETQERINFARDISIGDHVWLAENVVVLKGVRVGGNSIVGIGSIVTKDLPANSLAAGTPAKVIKTGVNWRRDRT